MYHTKQCIDLTERKTREQDEGLLKPEDFASFKDHYEMGTVQFSVGCTISLPNTVGGP